MNTKPYGLSVKAVIFDQQGRCLLIRRSAHNKNFVGCWEWPGGKADPGEDFASALHREVAEETGLTVELTGFACATSFEMPKVNVVLLCMEARLIGGDIRLSEEHDDFIWVPPADLSRYKHPVYITNMMLEYAARV
ncbi:MAG: NUDIX domain-containing protein [Pontiellaceae bacterium]|jgi:8-oxo-dGTP diphosphatase|nr:NUDIX domain-containing protein [Pontiellaceae bacterium]